MPPLRRSHSQLDERADFSRRIPFPRLASICVASRSRTTLRPCRTARIYIERVNAPFLAAGGIGDDFRAGIERAIALGWLWLHESGTYVKFTDGGAALFA